MPAPGVEPRPVVLGLAASGVSASATGESGWGSLTSSHGAGTVCVPKPSYWGRPARMRRVRGSAQMAGAGPWVTAPVLRVSICIFPSPSVRGVCVYVCVLASKDQAGPDGTSL